MPKKKVAPDEVVTGTASEAPLGSAEPDNTPPPEEKPKRKRVVRRAKKPPDTLPPAEDPPSEEEPPELTERQKFRALDFHTLDKDLTQEQQQEWSAIYASYRSHSVFTGTIVGVNRHKVSVRDKVSGETAVEHMYCAVIVPFRVNILIPSTEMWYEGEEKPDFVLRSMIGAKIDVVIIHVDREGEFAIGSRRAALKSQRRIFAAHPRLQRIGSRAKCNILSVGPRRCLVECNGFDFSFTQREMSYTAIPDLRVVYYPGQIVDCLIKEYDKAENKLMISVKEIAPNPFDAAEQRHPVGALRQAKISGKYGGGVFCNLSDGTVVMCSYSFHNDDTDFAIGDTVILRIRIYNYERKQIYGKITSKW